MVEDVDWLAALDGRSHCLVEDVVFFFSEASVFFLIVIPQFAAVARLASRRRQQTAGRLYILFGGWRA